MLLVVRLLGHGLLGNRHFDVHYFFVDGVLARLENLFDLLLGFHAHEAEAAGPVGVAFYHHHVVHDLAELLKVGEQGLIRGVGAKPAYEQLLSRLAFSHALSY